MSLSAKELEMMREAIEDLLPDTCNVLSAAGTVDGYGGVTQTWGTLYRDISFRLDMQTGYENTAGGAIQPYIKYKGTLPHDTNVTQAHRIQHDGVVYAVLGVDPNKSWDASRRVDLEKIE